jgi:hypothetical protein
MEKLKFNFQNFDKITPSRKMKVLNRENPRSITSVLDEEFHGLSIEVDGDSANDDLIFVWQNYGFVLDSFSFDPRSTEASELREFLLQVHTKGWYEQSSLPNILNLAEATFAEAKKNDFFWPLKEMMFGLDPEERRRVVENQNLVENFSFGSLLKKWFVNYLMLGLDCDTLIITSLAEGLEKTIEIETDNPRTNLKGLPASLEKLVCAEAF